jgi:hypothetical protein
MSDRTTPTDNFQDRRRPYDVLLYDAATGVQWIQDRVHVFFPGGRFDPLEAALLIEREALAHGSPCATIERRGRWWVIWSTQDWLQGTDAGRVFRTIVPNPIGGPNNLYYEIVLRAFARDIVTRGQGNTDVVKGALDSEVEDTLENLTDAKRIVAFTDM